MMELKELEKYGVDIKEINMLIKKAKEDTTYLVVMENHVLLIAY